MYVRILRERNQWFMCTLLNRLFIMQCNNMLLLWRYKHGQQWFMCSKLPKWNSCSWWKLHSHLSKWLYRSNLEFTIPSNQYVCYRLWNKFLVCQWNVYRMWCIKLLNVLSSRCVCSMYVRKLPNKYKSMLYDPIYWLPCNECCLMYSMCQWL